MNATATPAVVAYGPAPPVNHGASGSLPSVVAETIADHVPVGAARTRTKYGVRFSSPVAP